MCPDARLRVVEILSFFRLHLAAQRRCEARVRCRYSLYQAQQSGSCTCSLRSTRRSATCDDHVSPCRACIVSSGLDSLEPAPLFPIPPPPPPHALADAKPCSISRQGLLSQALQAIVHRRRASSTCLRIGVGRTAFRIIVLHERHSDRPRRPLTSHRTPTLPFWKLTPRLPPTVRRATPSTRARLSRCPGPPPAPHLPATL